METIFINGKFIAQHMTGVQRAATQLLRALDRSLNLRASAWRWVLLCPPEYDMPSYRCIESLPVGLTGLPLHVWEQTALPWAARRGILLNLAGSAPWWARQALCHIHDAAVFDHPEAYTAAFVRWYRALFRWQVGRGAQLTTVSSFSRKRLALHLHVPPARLAVLSNGGDHLLEVAPDDRFVDEAGLRGQIFLLAVASANPTKNLERLREAFAALSPAVDARLVIVSGRNAQVFARGAGASQSLPTGRIVDLPPLSDAALKALYVAARGFVFPSFYEGFGLPPLEAMSCDCPVAAARAASLPEICGEAALYFDPYSTADITGAMHALLTDDRLRDRLVVLGRERVGHWRWSASAEALRTLVEGCKRVR